MVNLDDSLKKGFDQRWQSAKKLRRVLTKSWTIWRHYANEHSRITAATSIIMVKSNL